MSDSAQMVLDVWSEFKLLVEQVEEDVHKNAVKGNLSAGVRVRKGVRNLRKIGAELIKATLTAREEAKAEKPAAGSAVEQPVEAAVEVEAEPVKKVKKAKKAV
jgi:hypothetical protein